MEQTPPTQSPDSLERTLKNEDSLINAETGAVGAASGIAIGALAGAVAGPPGAIAGAVIGGVVGALSGSAIGEQRREERIIEREETRSEVAIDQGFVPPSETGLPPLRVDAQGLPLSVSDPRAVSADPIPLVRPATR